MGMGKTIQMIALLLTRKFNSDATKSTPTSLNADPSTPSCSVDPQPVPSSSDVPQSHLSGRSSESLIRENSNDQKEVNPEGHGATLVITPLAAVLQWKQEIERFSVTGSLNVVLYHGSCREALLRNIHKYDVIITTYSTVEVDYRRVINTHKIVLKVSLP